MLQIKVLSKKSLDTSDYESGELLGKLEKTINKRTRNCPSLHSLDIRDSGIVVWYDNELNGHQIDEIVSKVSNAIRTLGGSYHQYFISSTVVSR